MSGTARPVVWEDGRGNPTSYPIRMKNQEDPSAPPGWTGFDKNRTKFYYKKPVLVQRLAAYHLNLLHRGKATDVGR